MKDTKDDAIQEIFKRGLKEGLVGKTPEEAASLLEVGPGTVYKYLAGTMIPGGQVLWRACARLGMVLDAKGFRVDRRKARKVPAQIEEPAQLAFSFINETIEGERISGLVRKRNEFVHVSLRIKVAG